MIEKKLKGPVAFLVFFGVILKMFESPYGNLVFTVGFAGYFLIKFIKLFKTPKYSWTKLHYAQLIVLIIAFASLIFLYFKYPYARFAFAILLLVESIINVKIMINSHIGNENFKNLLRFFGKLIKR